MCAGLIFFGIAARIVKCREPAVFIPAVVGSAYTVALLATSTLIKFDSLTIPRFWLVTLPLAAWFSIAALTHFWNGGRLRKACLLLPLVTTGLLATAHINAFAKDHDKKRSNGWYYNGAAKKAARYFAGRKGCIRVLNDLRPISAHFSLFDVRRLPGEATAQQLAAGSTKLCIAMRRQRGKSQAKRRLKALKQHMDVKRVKKLHEYEFYVAKPKG